MLRQLRPLLEAPSDIALEPEEGLLAGIATRSPSRYAQFAVECEVGIVIDGRGSRIHPGAPFGGRKASQLGPPEHGVWDRHFFTRVKACYRGDPA